jgi:hypothetical protein
MVLHRLLQLLFGHPQVGPQLVQRLSETRPIRGAARLAAYCYLRGKQALEEKASLQGGRGPFDVERFRGALQQELKKGFEEVLKRQQQAKK